MEKNNSEKNYEFLRSWLSDIKEPRIIEFLARTWRIDKNGVEQLSGDPANVNCKSVLIWYMTSGGVGEPSYLFVPLGNFSHGIFQDALGTPYVNLTLAEFRETATKLGAHFMREERYGESWLWLVFPEIPVLLKFSEADDEYPAMLDVKFGSNATTFLPFETLAVLDGLIDNEFKKRRS
jgi:hypothetical protein